jgi:hypothetical protein
MRLSFEDIQLLVKILDKLSENEKADLLSIIISLVERTK